MKNMDEAVREILDQVETVADFIGIKLNDINDTNLFGDNALHCVCIWGDLESAKLLVENGIDIEQIGEGGFTPLKVAHDFGHQTIVDYLISKSANTEAINAIFHYDPKATRKHIKSLEKVIQDLERQIESDCEKNA